MKHKPFAYFDSSVTAKRYLRESGRIEPVFRRKLTTGDIDARAYEVITKKLRADRSRWELVALSDAILESAESLAREHNIRTLDAIHLASARTVAERLGSLQVVTADVRQRQTATQIGLNVIWIE